MCFRDPRNCSVNCAWKAFSYTCFTIQLFNCPNWIFSLTISMYEGTKNCLQRCPIFRLFQSAKIFGRFSPEVKMHFLAIFLHHCVEIVIPNMHVKDHFNRLSRISPRVMWICLSFRLNLLRPQRENRNSTFCWISQNQKLSFSRIFENSLQKGFFLKINSRYLQYPGLKRAFGEMIWTFLAISPTYHVGIRGGLFGGFRTFRS